MLFVETRRNVGHNRKADYEGNRDQKAVGRSSFGQTTDDEKRTMHHRPKPTDHEKRGRMTYHKERTAEDE